MEQRKPDPVSSHTSTTITTDQNDPTAAWEPVFRALGLPSYQVRVEDKMACIKAPPEDQLKLLAPTIRSALVAHGKSLGYRFITLDLD